MRAVGSWPKANAGRQTEAQIDFRLRGGIVMMSRRVLPFSTLSSAKAIASRCQFWLEAPTGRHGGEGSLNKGIEITAHNGGRQHCWIDAGHRGVLLHSETSPSLAASETAGSVGIERSRKSAMIDLELQFSRSAAVDSSRSSPKPLCRIIKRSEANAFGSFLNAFYNDRSHQRFETRHAAYAITFADLHVLP